MRASLALGTGMCEPRGSAIAARLAVRSLKGTMMLRSEASRSAVEYAGWAANRRTSPSARAGDHVGAQRGARVVGGVADRNGALGPVHAHRRPLGTRREVGAQGHQIGRASC